MKFVNYTILSLAAAFALSACSNEEVERFEPTYQAINIGFGAPSNLTQESTFNYSESSGERAVTFYARISGAPATYDREFTIEAVGGDIDKAAGSFRTETYVVSAGEVSGEYKLYFDASKLSDPTAFSTDKGGELVFRVVPSTTFAPGADKQNELRFKLLNALTKPECWDTPQGYYLAASRYFGEYSPEKFRFMIENGCATNFRIHYSLSVPSQLENDIMLYSQSYANYLCLVCQKALAEYNATHDKPLCDSLGNPITF